MWNLLLILNVGISQTALICHKSFKIGNNVQMEGGVSVYDTYFIFNIQKYVKAKMI